jgi:ATP-dependent DNA helicase DinG
LFLVVVPPLTVFYDAAQPVRRASTGLSASAEILASKGPLARALPYFVPRDAQQAMAARIEDTLAHGGTFIAESGTGTGKTFAYLVPALLSGKKVLISTGTRNLQDQLFNRDLPVVREALGVPVNVALLKGRANYFCLHRFDRAEEDEAGTRRHATELALLRGWARRTRTGDIAEVEAIAEDSDVWPLVTSTPDNCLGSACKRYDDCYVNRARREALAAEVVVINHHLFFADLALREEGFGQLLPGAQAVIFDEAHQLPEVASNFLGQSFSSHQLLGLCRDAVAEDLREKSGIEGFADAVRRAEKAAADLRLTLGVEPRRAAWSSLDGNREFHASLEHLKVTLRELSTLLEKAAPRGQGLASVNRRALDLLDRLLTITENPPADYVAWYETTARRLNIHLTPLSVAQAFRERTADGQRAWVFTSATLAINGSFAHFQSQLGLDVADTGLWESPFDFRRQALLYLPPNLPEPADPEFTARVVQAALPVLQASRGRAFLLFTSHRALKAATEMLTGKLPYPLLVQGAAPRAELLERFRKLGNAVLLGTGSFWEGVDVRGEALSCVIIDKLPFASPDDPVFQARVNAIAEAGGSAFMDYQVPAAVIALKQGAGRLIRDVNDRGVLMLCDPRLLTKGYGRIFLASLPPLARTRELADVQKFFAADAGSESPAPVAVGERKP